MASMAPVKNPSIQTLEAAKAAVHAQLEALFEDLPAEIIFEAASCRGRHALNLVLAAPKQALSTEARNQLAASRMQMRSFERLRNSCALLEAGVVADILGVTKQALSKKIKAGHVIAYSHNRRKFFPEFQLADSKVKPSIKQLLSALELDPANETQINVLIKFLAQIMDFSNIDEKENPQPRYALIDNPDALNVIVRDYKNRLEMGK